MIWFSLKLFTNIRKRILSDLISTDFFCLLTLDRQFWPLQCSLPTPEERTLFFNLYCFIWMQPTSSLWANESFSLFKVSLKNLPFLFSLKLFFVKYFMSCVWKTSHKNFICIFFQCLLKYMTILKTLELHSENVKMLHSEKS